MAVEKGPDLAGVQPQQGLFFVDQALGDHVHRDLHRSPGSALAVPGLQHIENVSFDSEFDVLHFPIVVFQPEAETVELLPCPRHEVFELGDRPGGADPRHHIFALGIDQELPIQALGPGRGIAGKEDAGGRVLPQVAKNHLLDVDGSSVVFGYFIDPAVDDGSVVVPGSKDGLHCHFQLEKRVLRKGFFYSFMDDFFIGVHQQGKLGLIQAGVLLDPGQFFAPVQGGLKVVKGDAQDHIAEHLDKAAVTVQGKPAVICSGGQSCNRRVVEA